MLRNYNQPPWRFKRGLQTVNEVKETMVQTLLAAGGVMTWDQMVNAIPQEGRRHIWAALAELKAENKLEARNRFDPDRGGIFEIVRLGV